ncbi:MAG TPA: hypothetical protein VHU15_16405 [Stellaceae bacterium]|jgi:hypothetical protein|nr:hypothetical protein [Stellaceae bacterium]
MTLRLRRPRRFAAFAASGWLIGCLAGCELPHPFEADRPPAALMSIRDSLPVAVAPIEGEPSRTADELAPAVAKALQKRDIAATERSTSPASNTLRGTIERMQTSAGKLTLRADWRLFDPAGKLIGERSEQAEAPARDWEGGDEVAIGRLAEASAAGLAGLMQDEPAKAPVAAATAAAAGGAAGGEGRIRVTVRKISGAPGDGDESLAKAVATVLQRQQVDIVEDGKGKTDLYLDGEVVVAPQKGNQQHVKIVWHVRRADGAEIGTVGQENDVPKGLLDGPWGDVAYSVAIAAGDGIAQLVSRGAPERRGTS